jgi:pimeloyl-ACP methyl ester carboxylesterase
MDKTAAFADNVDGWGRVRKDLDLLSADPAISGTGWSADFELRAKNDALFGEYLGPIASCTNKAKRLPLLVELTGKLYDVHAAKLIELIKQGHPKDSRDFDNGHWLRARLAVGELEEKFRLEKFDNTEHGAIDVALEGRRSFWRNEADRRVGPKGSRSAAAVGNTGPIANEVAHGATLKNTVIGIGIPEQKLVISLHGIRTRGEWQKKANSPLQADGFRHEPLDYGNFSAVQFLTPSQRARKVNWFRDEYERLAGDKQIRPSVVAHSFGTYIVAKALEKYPELIFDRIILCGSIVNVDYDWDSVIKAGRVHAVLNQYSGRDFWVKVGAQLVPDTGPSGAEGFSSSNPHLFQQLRGQFRHADYFYPSNYRNNWLPFLRGKDPP